MARRFSLAVFTLFRNVAADLPEWIEFHKLVGVEHFYLYDHQSDDGARDLLDPWVRSGDVTIRHWTGTGYLHEVQIDALRHCLRRVRGETRWLAFFDVDEFLFPARESTLTTALERHYRFCSSVSIPWRSFGPSGHATAPPGLVAESYTRRAERGHPLNGAVKTIYRPGRIVRLGGYAAHRAWCVPPTRLDADHFQLNHYWTRARDALLRRCDHQRGMVRDSLRHYGISASEEGWKERLVRSIERDHCVEDLGIARFLPALRSRLSAAAESPRSA